MSAVDTTGSGKSFWQRPEGTTGKAGVFLLGTAGLIGLYVALPLLITLFSNLVLAAGLAIAAIAAIVALFIVWQIVTSKKTWFLYKMLCRKMTGLFIDLDPITAMETYVEDVLTKKLEKVEKNKAAVKGEDLKLIRDIDTNDRTIGLERGKVAQAEKEIEKLKEKITKLQEDPDSNEVDILNLQGELGQYESSLNLALSQIGRLTAANEQLRPLQTDTTRIYAVLQKVEQVSKYMIEDMRNEVAVAKRQRATTESAHGAMSAAMGILTGKGDVSYEMFISARESNLDHVTRMAGETIGMLEEATSIVNSASLMQGANAQQGRELIKQLDQKASEIMTKRGKKALNAPSANSMMPVMSTLPVDVATTGNKYGL